ncbi:MAG: hypothetical protein JW901_06770 [Dehalococcoidia bacterium]|nr:hypothetical protein [Dehalococcoidia bacterium]
MVCLFLYTLSYMDHMVLTVVLQPMKLEMGWSDTQLRAIQTVYMLIYGALAIPTTYLVDRWALRWEPSWGTAGLHLLRNGSKTLCCG